MRDCFLKRRKYKKPSFGLKSEVGFTLVELLAVLAIISLLAIIVVVSLGDSKDRARDSSIKSHSIEIAKAAEFLYNNNGSYDGICDDDGMGGGDNTLNNDVLDFDRIEEYLARQGGINTCKDSEERYIVISTMHQIDCWCIDWEGTNKEVSLDSYSTCGEIILDDPPNIWNCP